MDTREKDLDIVYGGSAGIFGRAIEFKDFIVLLYNKEQLQNPAEFLYIRVYRFFYRKGLKKASCVEFDSASIWLF